MIFRMPALASEPPCPKCGAANHDKAVIVWKVANGSGPVFDCDNCGHSWAVLARPDPVRELRLVQQTERGDPADRDV